jgi:hypothetical protein
MPPLLARNPPSPLHEVSSRTKRGCSYTNCARQSLEERKPCKWMKLEAALRVINPAQQEVGHQLQASLAWDVVRRTAKRRQRALRPRDGAPKSNYRWSPRRFVERGQYRSAARRRAKRPERNEAPAAAKATGQPQLPAQVVLRARHGGPTGVEEGGIGARGLSRNLGGLTRLRRSESRSGIAEARDDRDGARRPVRSRSSS